MEQANLPLISVIVPVYNIENYLPSCINSIMEQTYKNLEVILIDDESTDSSGELCDNYCIKDRRFRTIHQKNQGLSGARNTGLRECTGEYISFIDGDDYIHPQFYEVLYNAITKGDHSFSMVGAKFVYEGGVKQEYDNIKNPYTTRILSRDKLMEHLFRYNASFGDVMIMVVWNKLYKRETVKDLDFQNIPSEDNEYSTRVFLNTSSAIYVENAKLYYYVQRASSIMHQPFGRREIDLIKCFLTCLNDIPKNLPQYRGLALERLYKIAEGVRYYAPANFKPEAVRVTKEMAKSTMTEFVKNKHIPFIVKTSALIFYHCPVVFSFYRWLMQNPLLYKLYIISVHGKTAYSKT